MNDPLGGGMLQSSIFCPSDHLVSSPRVRFNLEPMHFEFSDPEDEDQTLKFRDRSPSDPLISLRETVDLRSR